jgi:GNAT superfamily N-acetyltransferase
VVVTNIQIDSNSKLLLHPISLNDQPELFELMKEIYTAAYSHFWNNGCAWYLDLCFSAQNLQKELSRNTSHYYFIEYNGLNAGILKYDFPFSPKQIEIPNAMKLHRLYLHEDLHGTGVAKALMNWLEKIARDAKLGSIWLEAMEQKAQARRFYEKMDYKLIYSYQLDFEQLKPEYSGIQIYQKKIIG